MAEVVFELWKCDVGEYGVNHKVIKFSWKSPFVMLIKDKAEVLNEVKGKG